MENPEVYSDAASPGRESLGEGSADLEKLLQTAGRVACRTCIQITIFSWQLQDAYNAPASSTKGILSAFFLCSDVRAVVPVWNKAENNNNT